MKKEKLTLEAIKQDLMKTVGFQLSNKTDWRFSYIVPITLLAVMVGVLLKNVRIAQSDGAGYSVANCNNVVIDGCSDASGKASADVFQYNTTNLTIN